MTRRIPGLAMLALLAGCQTKDPFDPGWSRLPGRVDPALSSIQMLAVPPQVKANAPFNVVVRTLGSSSCTRVAATAVKVSGLTVDITPYDEYATKAQACTDDLHAFEHQATVTLATPGQARIRLHARTIPGKDTTYEASFTVSP